MPIPESIPLVEAACLTDAIATPYHAVRLAGIRLGEIVVIYGIGDLGSALVQLAKLQGGWVIAVDILAEKLELARSLGASAVVNASEGDPVLQVKELTEGLGAHVAFEVAGRNDTTLAALDSVRAGGRVILVGATDEPINGFVTMPYAQKGFALARQLTLMAAWAMTSYEVQEVVKLRNLGLIDTKKGLTVLSLDQINEAFERKAKGELTRVVLTP
jgi:D-arabinose 1-dehydrogenase-like Zn-dependent alcohol dehydrogenase